MTQAHYVSTLGIPSPISLKGAFGGPTSFFLIFNISIDNISIDKYLIDWNPLWTVGSTTIYRTSNNGEMKQEDVL